MTARTPALDAKTLERIEAELHEPCGLEESEARDAGRILLVGAMVGADADKVANALGWDIARVEPFARRLLKNGVWRNGKTYCEWMKEDGGIAFAMDVNVALGFVERAKKPPASGKLKGPVA